MYSRKETSLSLIVSAVAIIGALALVQDHALANWKTDKAECEAGGGTWTGPQGGGDVGCVTTTCTGQGVGCGQEVEEEETSKGHLGNDPQHDQQCDGPGNSGDSSSHCN